MFSIRAVTAEDLPFFWEMLFEAAGVNQNIRDLGKAKALALPAGIIRRNAAESNDCDCLRSRAF